jgi:hypothetical protein
MRFFDRFKKTKFDEQRNILCPKCQSTGVLDIVYGYPSNEMIKLRDMGKISLGGCCVDKSNPRWQCEQCGHKWN